jgi:hypothetical protein
MSLQGELLAILETIAQALTDDGYFRELGY